MTGDDVVAEARTWVGTPFHHQARVKGHGVDCVGLVVGVARGLGLPVTDKTGYSRQPDGYSLERELAAQLDEVDPELMMPGDVLLFRMPRLPRHVGIYAGIGRGSQAFIHATSDVGRCVEVNLDAYWLRALRRVYRFRSKE